MTETSLARQITKMPRVYHRGRAEDAAALVAGGDADLGALADSMSLF